MAYLCWDYINKSAMRFGELQGSSSCWHLILAGSLLCQLQASNFFIILDCVNLGNDVAI